MRWVDQPIREAVSPLRTVYLDDREESFIDSLAADSLDLHPKFYDLYEGG
jgi:hypothetical protein